MILGLSVPAFTVIHVIISLIGIITGFVVVAGMLNSKRLPGWTAVFLLTTVLTDITGYFFPSTAVTPAQIVGGISLAILAITIAALYVLHLAGVWRWIYVVGALMALYLNTIVGVIQAFQKIGTLKALAPTQSEPPFLVAQAIVLVILVALGVVAARKFHPESTAAT